MSIEAPPTINASIFNSAYFSSANETTLTRSTADTRYLQLTGGTERGLVNFDAGIDVTGGDLTVDTNTLKVDSTNNRVGVNTTSPTVALDVTGATNISGNLSVATDDLYVDTTNHRVGINNASPTVDLDVTGSANISGDVTVDTNTLKVDSTNNRVGVNTTSPTVALDVTGAAKISGDVAVDTDVLKVDATNNRVGINTTSPSVALDVTGAVKISGNVAVDTNVLYVDTTNNRVGIVNSSPGYPLSVVGDCNLSSGSVYRINNNTVLTTTTLASSVVNSSLTSVGTLGNLTITGDLTVDTTTLRVDSTNNRVGIGIEPTYRLDCGGGLRVDVRDSADTSSHLCSQWAYDRTTASAANVFVASNTGDPQYALRRSTSSIKYKTQVEDILDTYSSKIYDLRPVYFRSLCSGDNPNWSHWGFIAEEVALVDPRLVHYAGAEPEGVQYDRIIPFLVAEIKKLRDRVVILENSL